MGLLQRDGRDLTARQLGVFLICYHEGEPQTVRGLAKRLAVPKPPISRAVVTLEESGLLRRKIDPADRRSVLLGRTAAGQAFFWEVRQMVTAAAKAAAYSGSCTSEAK